ncbi:MAG: hypothetical protein PHH13_00280 [Candidatus Peribacteraceae bacterium]|nr:hypothetical protein [Candidatus Peribacteraceae bacterium]
MPLFTYKGHKEDGSVTEGGVDAVSLQAARDSLLEMKIFVDDIQEEGGEPTVDFSNAWTVSDESQKAPFAPNVAVHDDPVAPTYDAGLPPAPPAMRVYFPIIDTLRLYAGWLLAGYILAFALGSYQAFKPLPFEIPYVMAFLTSPLILSFCLAAFLFLLFTDLHRLLKRGVFKGFVLTILAAGVFVLFRINV